MKKLLAATIIVLFAVSLVSSAAQAETIGQREALASAKSYLATEAFSRAGLISQLHSSYGEGFSLADSIWGVDHTHANWDAEAVKSARSYLQTESFSRSGLIDQLDSAYGEQFTRAQAVYAVNIVYR